MAWAGLLFVLPFRAVSTLPWLNFSAIFWGFMVPRSIIAARVDGRVARSLSHSAVPASLPCPDRRRVVEQAVLFLLLGQPRELGVEGMIGRQKRLLAMEDRRIRAGGVIEAIDLACRDRELDATQQRRVRVGLEFGVDEIRDLARLAVQLDQVGPVDLTEVGSGASLVDAEQRIERFEGRRMDVEGVRQEFADGRLLAGFVYCRPKKPIFYSVDRSIACRGGRACRSEVRTSTTRSTNRLNWASFVKKRLHLEFTAATRWKESIGPNRYEARIPAARSAKFAAMGNTTHRLEKTPRSRQPRGVTDLDWPTRHSIRTSSVTANCSSGHEGHEPTGRLGSPRRWLFDVIDDNAAVEENH